MLLTVNATGADIGDRDGFPPLDIAAFFGNVATFVSSFRTFLYYF